MLHCLVACGLWLVAGASRRFHALSCAVSCALSRAVSRAVSCAQGVSGNEARLTVMSRLFESARATSASSVMARGNQYRSNFEPNEYMLTPLAAAAIFGNHRVVEALLADRSVKVGAICA